MIIDWLRDFLNSDLGIVVGFISLLAWGIGVCKFMFRKAKVHLHTIKGLLLMLAILLFGLVLPVAILVFSSRVGVAQILLNGLAIFGILSFFGFLFITWKMNIVVATIKESPAQDTEQATIRLRTTHQFFNGDIQIYVEDVNFHGRPLGHKITAKIWSPNKPEIMIRDKGVGFSVQYQSNRSYRMRIVDAGINEATFQVLNLV
jgi:hypothetical protein